MFARSVAILLSAVLLAPIAGCGDSSQAPSAKGSKRSSQNPGASAKRSAGPDLSEAECLAFGKRLEDAVAARDRGAVDRCFDWDAITSAVVDSLPIEPKEARSAKSGLRSGISGPTGFGQQIIKSVGDDGSYSLLRVHVKDGRRYALFRLSGVEGLNYHDLLLTKKHGQVVAEDFYTYIAGELITQTVRRTMLPMVRQLNKNWIQKLSASDKQFSEHMNKIQQITRSISSGDGQTALNTFKKLPKELRENKSLQLHRYRAAALVGDDELVAAITEYERLFPNDAALALLAIDSYIVREDYDNAIDSIDKLDKSLGGDPYLDSMRCEIYLLAKRLDKAELCAQKAIQSDPESLHFHWSMVSVYLAKQDHAKVYQALKDMDGKFEMEWNDLRETEEFSAFASSSQGQRWLGEQGFIELPSQSPTAEQWQTWSDTTGKFSIKAKLVSSDGQSVVLEKEDGKRITVPLEKLSDKSRGLAELLAGAIE